MSAHAGVLISLMAVCVFIFVYLWMKDKNYKPGRPSLIPYSYIQLTVLIIFIVCTASLIVEVTGVDWQSPYRPY